MEDETKPGEIDNYQNKCLSPLLNAIETEISGIIQNIEKNDSTQAISIEQIPPESPINVVDPSSHDDGKDNSSDSFYDDFLIQNVLSDKPLHLSGDSSYKEYVHCYKKRTLQLFIDHTLNHIPDLYDEEKMAILDIYIKEPGFSSEIILDEQTKKIQYGHLLNKPHMTIDDKLTMVYIIEFLIKNNNDSPKNIKKLETINYGEEYIEIGGIRFCRYDLFVEANDINHNIVNDNLPFGDHFLGSLSFMFSDMDEGLIKKIKTSLASLSGETVSCLNYDGICEQNQILEKKGMIIPTVDQYMQALEALPTGRDHFRDTISGHLLNNLLSLKDNYASVYSYQGHFLQDPSGETYYGTTTPVDGDGQRCYVVNGRSTFQGVGKEYGHIIRHIYL